MSSGQGKKEGGTLYYPSFTSDLFLFICIYIFIGIIFFLSNNLLIMYLQNMLWVLAIILQTTAQYFCCKEGAGDIN